MEDFQEYLKTCTKDELSVLWFYLSVNGILIALICGYLLGKMSKNKKTNI